MRDQIPEIESEFELDEDDGDDFDIRTVSGEDDF